VREREREGEREQTKHSTKKVFNHQMQQNGKKANTAVNYLPWSGS